MRRLIDNAEGVLGSPVRNLVSILVFMGVVTVCAILAYMAAGWSLADASYMVAITLYTVGYGEVRPIDTPYLHGVTMALMVLGCTGMILLTSALVQLFTVLQLRQILGNNRMHSRIEKLSGHVVICGFGRIGVMLAQELASAGTPLVVVERSTARLAEAEAAGHLTLSGDATEEEVLLAAGVDRARVLATVLPDDAANVFITLSARNLNPRLEIIARGEVPTTERKLLRAGANHVVLPTHIGAERIARMILYPASESFSDAARMAGAQRELNDMGLRLELVPAIQGSAMCNATVADAERRAAGSFFIVQIERGAEVIGRPASDERILAGDQVLIVVRNSALAAKTLFNTKAEIRAGRMRF